MGSLAITQLSTVGTIVPGKAPNISATGWYAVVNSVDYAPATNQNLLDSVNGLRNNNCFLGVNTALGVTTTDSIQFGFDLSTPIFSLDGAPPISYNSLPAGFVITALNFLGATSGVDIANGQTGTVSINSVSAALPQTDFSSVFPVAIPNIVTGNPITPNEFIGLIFQLTVTTVPGTFGTDLSDYSMIGTYAIQSSRFTLQNTNIPVGTGSTVSVTSTTGGLNGVTQINLNWTDPVTGPQQITILQGSNYIISEFPDLLYFYIPPGMGSFTGALSISIIGDGIQFSSSVPLGTLQVIFADSSGIYVLDDTISVDMLYQRTGYSVTLEQIMLPPNEDDEFYFAIKGEENSDFYSSITYPRAVLGQTEAEEEYFSIIGVPIVVTEVQSTAIPSPFVRTAFLP
jgi:hypothetical protein